MGGRAAQKDINLYTVNTRNTHTLTHIYRMLAVRIVIVGRGSLRAGNNN